MSIYYSNTNIKSVITAILKVRRIHLGLSAVGNGLVHGNLFIFSGNKQIYKGVHNEAFNINSYPKDLKFIISKSVKYALIVEKKTIFNKLCQCQTGWTSRNCILFTGSGYPDLLSRQFIASFSNCMKQQKRRLPVFCFVDNDPHGLDIFLSYQQGTISTPESYLDCIPNLLYLGLEWKDIQTYKISKNKTMEMTIRDCQKINSMQQFLDRKQQEYFKKFNIKKDTNEYLTFQRINTQLKISKKVQKKFELETIANLDNCYLPSKISEMSQYYRL